MNRHTSIPEYWSAEQALAVYEFLDALRAQVWDRYGEHITEQMRREYAAQQYSGKEHRFERPCQVLVFQLVRQSFFPRNRQFHRRSGSLRHRVSQVRQYCAKELSCRIRRARAE